MAERCNDRGHWSTPIAGASNTQRSVRPPLEFSHRIRLRLPIVRAMEDRWLGLALLLLALTCGLARGCVPVVNPQREALKVQFICVTEFFSSHACFLLVFFQLGWYSKDPLSLALRFLRRSPADSPEATYRSSIHKERPLKCFLLFSFQLGWYPEL